MSRFRASRVDDNHTHIRKLFERIGAKVHDTSDVGNGFPDLVVQWVYPTRGLQTMLVEVKDGKKKKSARKLTKDQENFHRKFHCHIVETDEDVFKLLAVRH